MHTGKIIPLSVDTTRWVSAVLAAYGLGVGIAILGGELAGVLFDNSIAVAERNIQLRDWLGMDGFWSVLAILSISAIAEEILFRKLGFVVLRAEGLSDRIIVLLTTVGFAAAHLPDPVQVGVAAVLGVLLGTLYASGRDGFALCVGVHLGLNQTGAFAMQQLGDRITYSGVLSLPWWVYVFAGTAFLLGLQGVRKNVAAKEQLPAEAT